MTTTILHSEIAVGWITALIIVIILSAPCLIIGGIATWLTWSDSGPFPLIGGTLLAGVIWGIFTWAAWPPFSMQYHELRPVSGIVQSVSSRFLGSGNNSTTQKFSVEMNRTIYGCNDTRCSQVRPGDRIVMLCSQSWQANGVPGYDCNWGQLYRGGQQIG